MNFSSESEMSVYFKTLLKDSFSEDSIDIIEEFSGLFGIPDYLLVEKNENSLKYVIAVELKLKNWNRALEQAFKYKTFSNESYVVIDEAVIVNVLKHKKEFIHYNVGLASFNKDKELKVYHYPKSNTPFSKYYIKKMESKIIGESTNSDIISLGVNGDKCIYNVESILPQKFTKLSINF